MDARSGQEAPTDLLVAVAPRTSRRGAGRRRAVSSGARRRPAALLSAVLAGDRPFDERTMLADEHGARTSAATDDLRELEPERR